MANISWDVFLPFQSCGLQLFYGDGKRIFASHFSQLPFAVSFHRNHRNPTVQKEAIWPIESAPTTIPPRPYPLIPTYLTANPSNLHITGH